MIVHDIGASEANIGNVESQVADIENLNLTEGRHVRHKPVDSRTDVHVFQGVILEYPLRHQQVLMKIVPGCVPTLLVTILHAGIHFPKGKFVNVLPRLFLYEHVVSKIQRHAPQEDKERNALHKKPETHSRSIPFFLVFSITQTRLHANREIGLKM